jgi:hypothetical protein
MAGMVVPVWFSRKTPASFAEELLTLTLDNFEEYVRPENVFLVVDGDERSLKIARRVQKALAKGAESFQLLYLEENKGKHYAVTEGILHLMASERRGRGRVGELAAVTPSPEAPDLIRGRRSPLADGIRYFVVRDCDADHFICDLPNLVRSAHNISVQEKTDRVLVIGRRIDRHRPLGFRRGQMEELCNRILLDAMNYRLARRSEVLNSQHYSPYGDVPDFKSGYKLYSRAVARIAFTRNPRFLCLEPKDYWRHGAEPIPIVEAVMAGAVIGEMNRTTFDVQPTTTFTESSAVDMHVKTLAWAFCRLGIHGKCAEQMFNNHIPRLLLASDASGREQLDAIKRETLTFYANYLDGDYSHKPGIGRPRFF